MSDRIPHSNPYEPTPSHAKEIAVVPPESNGVSRAETVANDADTASDICGPRYSPIHASTSASNGPSGGVNVARAEAEFAELKKELSHQSRISRPSSRQRSHPQHEPKSEIDIEKGGLGAGSVSATTSDEESFDLEGTLRGNKSEEEQAGIKSKRIGVVWSDLTVKGIGGMRNYVKTFPMAFVSFLNVYETARSLLGLGKKGTKVDILRNFRGVAKPGEMVLVLGKPGSGCTTFLKVISNQRYGYTGVNGEVLYGPFDHQTFGKKYRGEAVYNGEDDIHHPTLTVGQTFDFALETKIPGKRPAGLSRAEFKEKVIELLLKMFNIEVRRHLFLISYALPLTIISIQDLKSQGFYLYAWVGVCIRLARTR
jgi:hypothetical protein